MIVWNLSGFQKLTEAELVKNMTKAGLYFTSKLRGYLNKSQPYKRSKDGLKYKGKNPSAPGDFPHKLSGQLSKSMTWNLDKGKLVLTVGSNLKGYPSFLETGTRRMQARPWLTLGWNREKNKIGTMITGNG
jgi:hypothetical protein